MSHGLGSAARTNGLVYGAIRWGQRCRLRGLFQLASSRRHARRVFRPITATMLAVATFFAIAIVEQPAHIAAAATPKAAVSNNAPQIRHREKIIGKTVTPKSAPCVPG